MSLTVTYWKKKMNSEMWNIINLNKKKLLQSQILKVIIICPSL